MFSFLSSLFHVKVGQDVPAQQACSPLLMSIYFLFPSHMVKARCFVKQTGEANVRANRMCSHSGGGMEKGRSCLRCALSHPITLKWSRGAKKVWTKGVTFMQVRFAGLDQNPFCLRNKTGHGICKDGVHLKTVMK